jgi:pimeloyl-ACP methyl ester carboxylesterase
MRRFERPTLVLRGKQDTNFGPALAERLARDIPGTVRIEWLEHSAHMPMQEEPDRYTAALLAFLDGVQVSERGDRPRSAEVAGAQGR